MTWNPTRMTQLKRRYANETCAHGYAGIASWFVALADRMVKTHGTIALVLPMTCLQGSSWQKFRRLIASTYRETIVVTIAAANQTDQSFSADTGMAETLVVCRQSSRGATHRGLFVSLDRVPRSEMESVELAKTVYAIAADSHVSSLEDGPTGGMQLLIGGEHVGATIEAPLSIDAPWVAAGVSDFSVIQAAYQLAHGTIWLPQMREDGKIDIPMGTVQQDGRVGVYHMNIVGSSPQAAFNLSVHPHAFPTFPMLWNHDAMQRHAWLLSPTAKGSSSGAKKIVPSKSGIRGVILTITRILGSILNPSAWLLPRTRRSEAPLGPISDLRNAPSRSPTRSGATQLSDCSFTGGIPVVSKPAAAVCQ